MPTVADVVAAFERRYPPAWCEEWDAVGLTCGDPTTEVRRVLFAVDPTPAVVDEAIAWDADLLVTHHPLLLRGVHSVAASGPKGRVVHDLIRGGVALLSAHTNADNAEPGVSDALASALGLTDLRPLSPLTEDLDKIVTFVPHDDADPVLDALAAAGAGRIGNYDRCGYLVFGTGTFRPLAGANPTIGEVGAVEQVPETRLEMVLPRGARRAVLSALRSAHPYEEPAFDLFELAGFDSRRGLGRVGRLAEPEGLDDFVGRVAAALPDTVAVCGGAGDSLLHVATRAGVDAYVTADLRHHPASEALDAGGPAVVDVSHWASEWPWLAGAADLLVADLGESGRAIETRISTLCTDPWTLHAETVATDLLEADDA